MKLSTIPCFSKLSQLELERIKKLFTERSFKKGETIFSEGDPSTALYFVKSGQVKLYKLSLSGRQQVIRVLKEGQCFGACALFNGGPMYANAVAVTDVSLLSIARAEMLDIAKRHPEVALFFLKDLAGKTRQLASLVEELSFKCVTARLADRLLELAAEEGIVTEQGIKLKRTLFQDELAALVGTVREVLWRSLHKLEREGAIELQHGHEIVIIDQEKLKHLA